MTPTHYVYPGLELSQPITETIKENRDVELVNKIINAACEVFGVDNLIRPSKNRGKRIVCDARKAVYYVGHRIHNVSKSEIGRVLQRDHASVIFGIQVAEDLMCTDEVFADRIYQVSKMVI